MSAPAVEAAVPAPRRRIAVGKKFGRGPFVVEMSAADKAAHAAASYVRRGSVALTDEEREDLSKKVSEINKRSSGR